MMPEFSRTVRLDTLGPTPRSMTLDADEAERAALADRFGCISIDRLSADLTLVRSGEAVTAKGHISAEVDQPCIATGQPVRAAIDEPFEIVFRPQPDTRAEEEIELGEAELDVVFYDGALVDVGEAVAETLALNLDPYPRVRGAGDALRDAGVKSEEEIKSETSPFAGLAALKDRLK